MATALIEACTLFLLAASPSSALEGHQAPAPLEVALGDLREAPSRHIGQELAFAIQIASVGEPWTPYPTRFGAPDWTRIEAWGDGQMLWERAEYRDSAPYLFARVGTLPEWKLGRARAHQRWWVEARVVQVFAGEPWIEITRAEQLDEQVGEGSVLHASRADQLWQRGQRALALTELERAMAGPLPDHARAALELRWRRWSQIFATEPEPPVVHQVPVQESVYHLELGPDNLPRKRPNRVALPASAPRR